MPDPVMTIPARQGRAVRVAAGAEIEVINPSGTQVVDLWALCPPDLSEHLSMEHTRVSIGRLVPRVGDPLYSNARRPLLTLTGDTSPGVHDTLMASCDTERYRLLGHDGYHDNCKDNYAAALDGIGLSGPPVPAPLNLFMNVRWAPDGTLRYEAPRSGPGDLVRLRAEVDVIVVMSACPQDLIPVNGQDQRPREAQFRVIPQVTSHRQA